jgi:hemoglobin
MQDNEAATATPFELIGGEPSVRELIDRFYDLMDREPAYAGIRSLHPPDLAASRDKLFWYLCGWLGGPQHYAERFGHPMLRARHLRFSIGVSERDQWMSCMTRAMDEAGLPPDVKAGLVPALMKTADWMRNREEDSGS